MMGEDDTACRHTAIPCVIGHWAADTSHQTACAEEKGRGEQQAAVFLFCSPLLQIQVVLQQLSLRRLNTLNSTGKTFTFTCSLQISLQAAGRTDVLGAAKSSAWTAGGAQQFPDTVLMVITTASRHRAARHFPTCRFTAETGMIAWRWQSTDLAKKPDSSAAGKCRFVQIHSPFRHSKQMNLPSGWAVRPRHSR